MMEVAAAVIEYDGRILIARRKPGGRFGGLWEFPGGKVEAGERPEDALVREIAEELGLQIAVGVSLGVFPYRAGDFAVELYAFRASVLAGKVRLDDHDRLLWARPEEFDPLGFSPADLPIVQAVRQAALSEPLLKGAVPS